MSSAVLADGLTPKMGPSLFFGDITVFRTRQRRYQKYGSLFAVWCDVFFPPRDFVFLSINPHNSACLVDNTLPRLFIPELHVYMD